MLTFLELYQTLLGFVFFKLYTDAGLVYPPPLDAKKDEAGAGVGAFSLQDVHNRMVPPGSGQTKSVDIDGRKISGKDVRQTIKTINASAIANDGDVEMASLEEDINEVEEEFIAHSSTSDPQASVSLPTLKSLNALPASLSTNLFSPYSFYLSRETSRPIFEFIVRSFGGRIGWPPSSGSGSPFDESDDSITHVIIDRPVVERPDETPDERERRLRRKYIQPQWVVDCINAGKILLEDSYTQGGTLPPHLSPFGEYEGAYDPSAGLTGSLAKQEELESEEDIEVEDDSERAEEAVLNLSIDDPVALRAAELAAEAAGVDYGIFEKEVSKSQKNLKKSTADVGEDGEKDMNKMMMSNKQKKLYEKMKYSQRKRENEVRSRYIVWRISLPAKILFCVACYPRGKKNSYSETEKTGWEGLSNVSYLFSVRFGMLYYLYKPIH